MASQKLGFSLRPERVAFLVNVAEPYWHGTCARIIEYCSLMWGGAGNIIIPTDGYVINTHFWRLLEQYEPDYVTYYKRTGADIRLDQPEKFAEHLSSCVKQWESQIGEVSKPHQIAQIQDGLFTSYADDFKLSAELQDELRRRLAPFYFGEYVAHSMSANSEPRYPHTQISHVLLAAKEYAGPVIVYEAKNPEMQLWIASALGYVREKHYSCYTGAGLSVKSEIVNDLSTVATEVVSHANGISGNRASGVPTPMDMTRIALGSYEALSNHDYDLSTQIVAGDGLIDFCYYMCLSRMRVRVVWLPPWILRGIRNISDDAASLPDSFYFCSAIRSAVGYSSQHSSTIELVSLTMDTQERSESIIKLAEDSLTALRWHAAETFPFALQPLRLYERNNAGIPELYEVNSEGVIELYTGRTPKHLKNFSPQNIRWIAEIAFGDVQIPRHSALGTWLAGRTTSEARTCKNQLCYLNVNMMVLGSDDPEAASYRPHLRVPTTYGIFQTVSSRNGIRPAPSDKGIYTKVMLEKLGGLDKAARFFRSHLGQSLVDAYQAGRHGQIGIYLADEQRRFLDWQSIRNFCADDAESTELIDTFSRSGIFYRGFIFQCEMCRRSSWYSVADLRDTFICKRCHREQTYTSAHWKKPHQPLWYHQLDEVVYQAIRNDCNVPILALAALAEKSKGKLSFCEELEFVDEAGQMECDLNCIVDGELSIGEVKKNNCLAASRKKEVEIISKYLALAERLDATRVIFATLEDRWQAGTTHLVESQFRDKRPKVVLLNGTDLLPG